jgi:predicted amidophosphoribosyltransferase
MLVIEKIKKGIETGICISCQEPASKIINGLRFCPGCGDSILVKIIGTCIKGIEEAKVAISILPKGIKRGNKKSL